MYNNHLSDQYMKYQLEKTMYNNQLSDQHMKYQLEGTMYNNHLSDQYMKYLLEGTMYNNHLSDQYMKYPYETSRKLHFKRRKKCKQRKHGVLRRDFKKMTIKKMKIQTVIHQVKRSNQSFLQTMFLVHLWNQHDPCGWLNVEIYKAIGVRVPSQCIKDIQSIREM